MKTGNKMKLSLYLILLFSLMASTSHSQEKFESYWRVTPSPITVEATVLAADSNDVVYAAAWGDGIYKTTTKGKTWVKISTGLTNSHVTCLEIDSKGNMYAGTMGGGLFVSTNKGDNWKAMNQGLTNLNIKTVGLAYGTTLYVGTYGSGVFRTDDGCATWVHASEGLNHRDINCMAVTADSSVVAGTNGGGIYKSTNRGKSWYRLALQMKSQVVTDMARSRFGEVFAITYGDGVYVSYMNGSAWQAYYHNMANMPLYGKCLTLIDAEYPAVGQYYEGFMLFDIFYAGIPDSSAWRYTVRNKVGINDLLITKDKLIYFSESYYGVQVMTDLGKTYIGERGFQTDIVNKGLSPLFAWDDYLLSSSANGGIYMSEDKGNTWALKGLEGARIFSYYRDGGSLYAATGGGPYRSTDNGVTWKNLSWNRMIYTVAVSGPNILIADSAVRYSTNDGQSWTMCNKTQFDGYVHSILGVDHNGYVYVVAFDTNTFTLYRSVNHGVTFDSMRTISYALCFTEHNGKIYIGTRNGIYISNDAGVSFIHKEIGGEEREGISQIFFNKAGDMFIVSDSIQYMLLSNDDATTYTILKTGIVKGKIRSAAINQDGDLFMSTTMLYRAIQNSDMEAPLLTTPPDDAENIENKPLFMWSDVENRDLYEIEVSLGNDFSQMVESAVMEGPQWQLYKKLDYGRKYYWRVRSKRYKSHSNWSEVYSFTTATAPPELEYPPDSSYSIDTTIAFSWKSVPSATTYQIQASTDEGFSNIILDKSNLTKTTKPGAPALSSNTHYYWRVRSYLGKSASAWSDTWVFTTRLRAPDLLKPSDKAITQSADIPLLWDTVAGASSYNVVLATDPNFTNVLHDGNTTQTSFSYGSYEVGNTYYWKVRALDLPNEGYWSEARRFTISQSQLTLIYPQNHSKNIPNDTPFEWNGPSNAESYHLQVSKDSSFKTFAFEETTLSATTKTVPGLEYGKYFWRVRYKNGDNYSEWTDTWQFTTDPGIAVLISPTDKSYNVVLQPELTWDAPKIAVTYIVEVATDSGFTKIVYKKDKLTNKKITLPQLKNYTKYYWHVRFTVGTDTSLWSETWTFGTCLAKTILVAPDDELKNCPPAMYFSWKSVTGATHYHLQFARDEAFADIYRDYDGIADTFMLVSDLDTSMTYYWRVNAHNEDGEGVWSVTWVFSVSGGRIGVEEDSPGKGLLIKARPNPFAEEAVLEYTLDKDAYVEIYLIDPAGTRVATLEPGTVKPAGRQELHWDSSLLSQGAYYYFILINNKEHIYKILKIK